MTTVARPRAGAAVATVLGLAVVLVATVVGWNAGWLDAIVSRSRSAGSSSYRYGEAALFRAGS